MGSFFMMSDNKALDPVKFDSKPLNGLRGILSIHLVLFHSILFSQAKINTYGQVHMPLYFLLSGFCLTLGYGKKKYSKISGCCSSPKAKTLDSTQSIGSIFDSTTFYFKRLTRVLPVYYVCFLYSLPLSIVGWYIASGNPEITKDQLYNLTKELLGGSISALFVVQTWLIEFGY